MLADRSVVFLLDVDNTLLDNDRFGSDLGTRLAQLFGAAERERRVDGWVSMEVSPLLASDTAGTIDAAARIYRQADRHARGKSTW